MFNFAEIQLIKSPNDNFVGIRKSESGDSYHFYLPNGFNDFPEGDFDEVRGLFFKMYRTFRKFENDNKYRVNRNRTNYQQDQDQTIVSSGGLALEAEDGESCQLYSKLRMIEKVLETYDDLAINSIQKKIKRTHDIDYSQIYKYLDRAIYLENDVIYIEVMDLPRPVLRYESTDIVNLYCYILDEIVQQLDEDVPDNIKMRVQDIRFLAQHFKDDYLTSEQSIFDKDTFSETTNILKEALDNIDKNTYYKDSDYWGLYEAIETFLYGELNPELNDGEYWGIKGFSLIWEDMCNTYFFKNHRNKICFADTDITLKNYHNSKRKEDRNRVGNLSRRINDGDKFWTQWFYSVQSDRCNDDTEELLTWHELLTIELDSDSRHLVLTNDKIGFGLHPDYDYLKYEYDKDNNLPDPMRRFLYPDLVLCDNPENPDNLEIIDYKDVPLDFYVNSSNLSPKEKKKYNNDITKQLTYELALQQTHDISKSLFFIPYYYEYKFISPENSLGEIERSLNLKGIFVFKADFSLIQHSYLEENL